MVRSFITTLATLLVALAVAAQTSTTGTPTALTTSSATGTAATTDTTATTTTPKTSENKIAEVGEYVDCRDDKDRDEKKRFVDCRESFEASYYVGVGIDNFAGDNTLNYFKEDVDKLGTNSTRLVTGLDFAYRLFGQRRRLRFKQGNQSGTFINPETDKPEAYRAPQFAQLWIYGETIHGVRTKEVDCSDGNFKQLSVCQKDGSIGSGDLVGIAKSASTLESYLGLRYEFAPLSHLLQSDETDRARVYAKIQYGAISVAGTGKSTKESFIGVGATTVSGVLEGSYLDIGTGRTDLFRKAAGRRIKLDAFISIYPTAIPFLDIPMLRRLDERVRPFAQLTVDAGRSSDSYQSYFGFDFIFAQGRKKAKNQAAAPATPPPSTPPKS
jgi:hypothetical protein